FCYQKQKDYVNSVHFLKKAITLEANKAHWYLHLATVLGALNKNAEALHYLNLGIEVDKHKKYQKKYTKLSKKLHADSEAELGAENIFIQSVQKIKESTFLYTIEGTIATNFYKDNISLYIESRENTIEGTLPYSLSLEPYRYEIDNNGFFTASFLLNLSTLKIDSDVVIYTFDFTLKADKEYRIKIIEDLQEVWQYKNYDFIPYATKYKNYSLMGVRKASKTMFKKDALKMTFFLFKIHYKGGVSKVTIDLVNALAEAGHNITLTTMVLTNTSNMYPISEKVNFNYISIASHYPVNSLPVDAYSTKENISPFFLHDLNIYFSKSNMDVFYTPIYASPVLVSIMTTIPSSVIKIVGDHSSSRYEMYSSLLNDQNSLEDKKLNLKIKRTLFFKNINNIDAIHLINPLVKEILIKETNKVLITIPNIIDFGSKVNKHKPLKERKKNIILVGSLLKVKNFDTVIQAFSRLEKLYPEWVIEIYGAGSEEGKLVKLIKVLKLVNKVQLKGFTTDIQGVYENSMIHLSASHKESFGLTIVESMHCGSITISTHQTIGAKYLIDHEKTGFLAEDNTEEGIYNILKTVLSKIEEGDSSLIDIQTNAYEASNNFNSINIVQQWEKAIESLQKDNKLFPINRVL
ncbi:MAG TPA: glycosyltransferase, partial [Arcobacter sp.]|nr:glycosyltransferase [Arcobacter sp.]